MRKRCIWVMGALVKCLISLSWMTSPKGEKWRDIFEQANHIISCPFPYSSSLSRSSSMHGGRGMERGGGGRAGLKKKEACSGGGRHVEG